MTARHPADDDRDVIAMTEISSSDKWWAGVVVDYDPDSGDRRVRLEREVLDDTAGWKNVHTWRVRPDFWNEERNGVNRFRSGDGKKPPAVTPVDEYCTVTRSLRVRRDNYRWVSVVRLERPWRSPCTRLYHWSLPDKKCCQSWTVRESWTKAAEVATRQLKHHVLSTP